MDRQMIEQIVLEVARRMMSKPSLLICHDGTRDPNQLKELTQRLIHNWEVSLYAFGAESDDLPELSGRSVLFLDADQDLLVRGAQGMTGTSSSRWLAESLLAGNEVYLHPSRSLYWILEPKQEFLFLAEGKKRYRELLYRSKEALSSFGAKFITESELLEGIVFTGEAEPMIYQKKLLTQLDVEQLKVKKIRVAPTTIVTPLARDALRANGMELIWEHKGE